ncbi:hypothetical protein GQ54DRAFT_341613 [Martensiomyces pterosporus]|nr:hypothetical protein GQ54DRAFT_341613 [Martensiomyces pterosporus]
MEKRCARIPARKLVRSCKWVIYVLALLLGSMYLSYVVVYDEMTWHISKMIDRDPCSYSCEDSPMALDALRHISAGDPPYAYIVGSDQGSKSSKDELGREDPLYRDSRVTVSINMMRPMVDDRNANEVHVYEGTVRLYDPGLYEVDARLEQRNGEWNAEPGQPTVDFSETKMRTMVPGNEYVRSQVQVLRDTKHPTYLKRHQNLPLCTQGDEAGRWVPEENLPKSWRPWQYAMPAEDGRVWLPYHCRLRRISHAEFVFHMSLRHSSVHWYGDSNSRRSIRPFMLGGKWCHENSTWTRLDCLCNDAPKDLFPDEWYTSMPVPHWYRIHTHGANGSEVFADLSKQPLRPTDKRPILPKDPIDDGYYGPDYMPPGYANRNDYFDLYYLFTRGTLDMYGSYWDRDITEHNITRCPG